MSAPERDLRVAVVQLALEVGAVDRNLRHVEEVVRSAAREHHPDVIVLPDSLTSPIVHSPAMLGVARQVDGEPYELLRRLAREYDCWVGGGFLSVRGRDAQQTYVLAEPTGATHLHDRDQPTTWEAGYAAGRLDDGFASTPLGPLGLVTGAEWIRSRTAQRLRGYVRLMLGGACWWSYPAWRPAQRWLVRREHPRNVALAREAPARMARIVGAPAAIAQQVGSLRGGTPLLPGVPWRTALVGESQIVERDGTVLARLAAGDGPGHVAADVRLADPEPLDPLPRRFWVPTLPATMHAAWLVQGLHGRIGYARRRRAGAFPWQAWPRHQLYPYNPPEGDPESRPERSLIAEPFGVDPIPDPVPETAVSSR